MWWLAKMDGYNDQVQSMIGCTAFVCNAFTTNIPQRTLAGHVVNQAGLTRRDFRLQLLQCCGACALSSACLGPKGKVVVLDNAIRESCCIHPPTRSRNCRMPAYDGRNLLGMSSDNHNVVLTGHTAPPSQRQS